MEPIAGRRCRARAVPVRDQQDRALLPVNRDLRELQDGRCFYCGGRLKQPEVDHFVPWARVPLDALENLVVADAACNRAKRDHLAAMDHVEAWASRLRHRAADLEEIARRANWERAPDRALGVARASYLLLPSWARLWRAQQEFVTADPQRLSHALG